MAASNGMQSDTGKSLAAGEHVVVCGLGNVGYRAVRLLMRLGQRGVVITRQVNKDWERAIEPQFCVIVGDARDDQLLIQAGVGQAKAVIIVTDDDLANLSIALDARRMNPLAMLVVRQFDQELAVHLEKSADFDRVLSASALASGSFVAATLGTTVHCSFAAGTAICDVAEDTIDTDLPRDGLRSDEWSARTGQAALAFRHDGQVILPCDADSRIRSGDRLISLRLTDDEAPADIRPRRCPRQRPGISRLRRIWMGCCQWWRDVPRAMRAAMAVLSLIVLVSVFIFHAALGISFVDALYFVVTTITTVGYGDYHLMETSAALKLYGVFVMLCGAAILAVIVSIATDLLLRTRLRDLMAHGAEHYRDHIIVAGLGNIGFRLVRDLVKAGQAVVAVEHRADAPFLQASRELVPVVLGNTKTEETLRKAGVGGAKAVVAVTDNDLANLSTALASKRIQPSCRAVLRIFNSELAEKMQRGMAMDAVLSVSAAAMPTFVAAAICPNVLRGFLLDGWLLAIVHRVFADKSARDEHEKGTKARHQSILFVKRAGKTRYETAAVDGVFQQGDEILGARWYQLEQAEHNR
jgi:Trk K+ transport system NAD-binding subunit